MLRTGMLGPAFCSAEDSHLPASQLSCPAPQDLGER